MRNNAQVMFQIADVYRMIEDGGAAVDWLQQALSVSQTDPRLLQEKLQNSNENRTFDVIFKKFSDLKIVFQKA